MVIVGIANGLGTGVTERRLGSSVVSIVSASSDLRGQGFVPRLSDWEGKGRCAWNKGGEVRSAEEEV
jgi:hypothetical protein